MKPWILGAMAAFAAWASAIATAPVAICLRREPPTRCTTEVVQAAGIVGAFVTLAAGLLVPNDKTPPNP